MAEVSPYLQLQGGVMPEVGRCLVPREAHKRDERFSSFHQKRIPLKGKVFNFSFYLFPPFQ